MPFLIILAYRTLLFPTRDHRHRYTYTHKGYWFQLTISPPWHWQSPPESTFSGATKQLLRARQDILPVHITEEEEVVAAMRHENVIFGPNGDHPTPDWVLARMDANELQQQQWQHQRQQEFQQFQQQQAQFQQELQQQIAILSRKLLHEIQRSMNRSIRTTRDALVPVVRMEDGQYPEHFPTTMNDCMRATGRRINLLLDFYNLGRRGTLRNRKKRLQRHLGCNL